VIRDCRAEQAELRPVDTALFIEPPVIIAGILIKNRP